ncbi:patatin-like phospholipase family protein [Anaeromyxobacter sp. Fw109-5]|uniref:patatin-like phospholipase family protein n=1 Tax=Anaeromyxobacter sp. (strain Fw109-5) TaxID=404589 RepID=UPI0000ED748B|nr:patatin-like phospholipase family protein [Anaeromyxobacter sp. Fw109-5]ABS26597.1 Patatin [Anaeromyxobacter sp. Fw109-5]
MGHTGLVLTGGGARAAYQVGALRALADVLGPGPMPFDIIAGISAGAINSLVVATGAEDFIRVTQRLRATWESLAPDRVFRTGTLRLATIGGRWIRDLSAGGLIGKSGINYLLDPAPLRRLLESEVPVGRMRRHLRSGRLRGVAVSATNYHTGAGVTFYEGAADIQPWLRSTRLGIRSRITLDHVMASAAIPVFFPPIRIDGTFYGDGCVRMNHPMSPAIHLGAERILAVSVRYLRPPGDTLRKQAKEKDDTLPLSEIAGVLLNAVFLDSLDADLERLERINKTLALIPRERLNSGDVEMRQVPALVLRPSQDLGKLAADEYERFPAMLRYLLKGVGASGHAGEDLLSYLAFEPIYLKRVMDLGYADTLARRDEIEEFFLGAPQPQRERARG